MKVISYESIAKLTGDGLRITHNVVTDGIIHEISTQQLEFESAAAHCALIALGWTPPEEK